MMDRKLHLSYTQSHIKAGWSMPVVHTIRVRGDRVRFPAARRVTLARS